MSEQLSQDEKKVLESLADPDEKSEDCYAIDEEIQREIIGLLLNNRSFLIESQALVKPSYFTNEVHQVLCRVLFKFFDTYRTMPNKNQLAQLLRDELEGKKEETVVRYLAECNTILEFYVPGLDSRDFYRDIITDFAKQQAMKVAIAKVIEEYNKKQSSKERWSKIEMYMKDALSVDHNFDLGLDYFTEIEERYRRRKEIKETGDIFTMGFPAIDNALKNGGLIRGEMGSWVGLSGSGKSLALVQAGIANLNRGKKVLYVSLEIDQDAVAERFDAQVSDPKNEYGITVSNLMEKEKYVIEGLHDYVSEYDDKRLLVIKQFPPGSLDIASLRAYFSQITLRGFRPDLVIVDYLGEMKDYPGIPTHESRYRITRDLRGFAVEEQVCVLTAMQPNRSAKEAVRMEQVIDDDMLSDSFAQIKPLDAMWSINQFQDERDCGAHENWGLARIYVVKHREGKARFFFPIKFDYNKLKLQQISNDEHAKLIKQYRLYKDERASESTMEQQALAIIDGKGKKRGSAPLAHFNDGPVDQETSDDAPNENMRKSDLESV